MIEVVSPGLLTTVQDRGRPGWAHIGVPPSGAVDPVSYELGNRLVGNEPGAAALEATLIGPQLRFARPALVALTGSVSEVRAVEVEGELDVGQLVGGARAYVCVRGGIDVEPVLGSRSTDLLTGLGPPPLQAGDLLRIGSAIAGEPVEERASPKEGRVLGVVIGPRDDWFTAGALEQLTSVMWRVSPASNRVGIRLEGAPLERARDGELLSEGLVTGALQVPPNGHPILLLNDHPTTGGYPVIAVVVTRDLPRAGRLRPGDRVRFAV